jgi:hypothetical protein
MVEAKVDWRQEFDAIFKERLDAMGFMWVNHGGAQWEDETIPEFIQRVLDRETNTLKKRIKLHKNNEHRWRGNRNRKEEQLLNLVGINALLKQQVERLKGDVNSAMYVAEIMSEAPCDHKINDLEVENERLRDALKLCNVFFDNALNLEDLPWTLEARKNGTLLNVAHVVQHALSEKE